MAFRKAALIAACVAVMVSAAVPALAANLPSFYALLYRISPTAAQFFMPINRTCETNGIALCASAVYIRDNKIDVLFTLKDVEQDRIDQTVDLMDGYWVHCEGNSILNSELADYDAETKTATFLMTFTASDVEKIAGDKVTVGVDSFYVGQSSQEPIPTRLDLERFSAYEKTVERFQNGLATGDESADPDSNIGKALVPYDEPVYIVAPGCDISAIGYVGNSFTVQLHTAPGVAGYLVIELLDDEGNPVDFQDNNKFRDPDTPYPYQGNEYEEYRYNIPKDVIGEYSLSIGYHRMGERVAGPWIVTFPLSEFE